MGISGVKSGAKAWSDAPQQTSLKSDGMESISAIDKAQMFQGEEIGDTLNKVADPNWVDTSKKMRTAGKSELDKDAFMTLLLTQMKNQDPTNPLKSHEMAAQLAQFTSLEKLSNIDSGIEKLNTTKNPAQNFEALSFIGKSVLTDSSKVNRGNVNEVHDLNFVLAGDAVKADIQVKDASGNVIRNLSTNNLKSGKNTFSWNGVMDDGTPAPQGEFSFEVNARSSSGSKIHAETKMEGVVTGVNFTPKGPQVMVGKQAIDLLDIKTITDPKIQPGQTNVLKSANENVLPIPGAGRAAVKPQEDKDAAKKAKLAQGNINDMAMTQEFINKLSSEGAEAGMGHEAR